VANRMITVWKTSKLVTQYPASAREHTYLEIWPVPEDFTDDEMALYEELCVNGQLNVTEAQTCVRKLRN
jgi:hypothetical protein